MRSAAVDRRLEAIAGPPLAMLTIPNTASDPLDIGVTEPRIMYAVASTSETANASPIANLGGTNNIVNGAPGIQVIRSNNVGIGGFSHRAQTLTGITAFQSINVGWPWNSPLAACGWWTGAKFFAQALQSNIPEYATSGEMAANPTLRLAPVSIQVTPLTALAYRGVHDLATRTRILAWLMRRYQVSPPPPPLDSTRCCRRADLVLAA